MPWPDWWESWRYPFNKRNDIFVNEEIATSVRYWDATSKIDSGVKKCREKELCHTHSEVYAQSDQTQLFHNLHWVHKMYIDVFWNCIIEVGHVFRYFNKSILFTFLEILASYVL